ncbi:hypothetical protein HOG98_10060 [bacterium]|jgi:hypothetical protein|nr:hypothetical protein [bacterium]
MLPKIKKGADSLMKIVTYLGFETNEKTGGCLQGKMSGAKFNKFGDSLYIMNSIKDKDVVFHNSFLFLKTLKETERHLKLKLFG